MFEGHSIDYQAAEILQKMVEDGICILKVGTALTFAFREGLFALSHIDDLISENPASFMSNLETEMLKDPTKFENHYFGNEKSYLSKENIRFLIERDTIFL